MSEINVFAGQVYGIHVEFPITAFEVPGAHAVQFTPAFPAKTAPLPVKPAAHIQSLLSTAPSSENKPTGQIEHGAGPVAALNVPAAHAAHAAVLPEVYPTLQLHVALPASESEFWGHA